MASLLPIHSRRPSRSALLHRTPGAGSPRPLKSTVTRALVIAGCAWSLVSFAAAPRKAPGRELDVATTEDTAADGQLVALRPGEKVALTLKRWPKHGQATLDAATGAFHYQPEKDFNGDDSFAVEVGTGPKSSLTTISVHVAAENDAPTLKTSAFTVQEDGSASGAVEARDVDKDILTFTLATPPSHGQARVDSRTGAFTYRPAPDYAGSDAFTIEVNDGAEAARAEVPVMVTPVNDAPVAQVVTQACVEDTPCDGKAVATDVDGDALTWKVLSAGKRGTATLDAATGAFSYRPQPNFHGEDVLVLEVSDGKLKAVTQVRLTVASVNDEPVASAASASANEDEPASGRVLASDLDGDVLTYRVGAPPQHGTVNVDPRTGAFTYDGKKDFFGADGFTIEVSDGVATASAPVQVTLAPVNDAPVATASAHALDEDTSLTAKCPATDVEGDALTFSTGTSPKHGALTINPSTGDFSYTPARDYQGPDSFTFQVSDGRLKAEAVVRLTVRPVNDAPVSAPLSLSANEDEAAYGAIAASDVDGQPLKYEVREPPAHGAVKVDARTGAVHYQPARDYHGPDRFVIAASDGTLSATSQVDVTLAPVDDPPTTRPLRVALNEDTSAEGALPGADVDGDALTFKLVGTAALGSVELVDAATGAFRYTPRPDQNGDDRVSFEVTDGRTTARGTVELKVAPVNDAPTLSPLRLATNEDVRVEGAMASADIDADPLTWRVVTQPQAGKAFVDAAGKVRFEPSQDQNGEATFEVVVSDGALSSPPAKVTVAIAPVNDAPVAQAGTSKTNEDTEVTVTLLAHDVDGDVLTFSIARQPAHGELTALDPAKGSWLYVPAANYNGDDGFAFTVKDPSGLSSTAEQKVVVAAVNDAPVALGDDVNVPCNGQVTGLVQGYDRERAPVTFRVVRRPSQGHLKSFDARSGQFVLDMEGATDPETSFDFVASDGALDSAPVTVNVHTTCAGAARASR